MKYNQIVDLRKMEDIRPPKLGVRGRIINWLFKNNVVIERPEIIISDAQDLMDDIKESFKKEHPLIVEPTPKGNNRFYKMWEKRKSILSDELSNKKEGYFSKKELEYLLKNISFENNGCWNWIGKKYGHDYNYAYCTLNSNYNASVVRSIYKLLLGPINNILKNTCGNKNCVNPLHFIENLPLTDKKDKKNIKIGSKQLTEKMIKGIREQAEKGEQIISLQSIDNKINTCKHGHLMTEDNIFTNKKGRKECKKCRNIWRRTYYLRHMEEEKAYARQRHARIREEKRLRKI